MNVRRTGLVIASLALAGCETPIRVQNVGVDRAYHQVTESALTGPNLSTETLVVLGRYGLEELAEDSPDLAIMRLKEMACRDNRPELLFALADLSYATGGRYERNTWVSVHQDDGKKKVTLSGREASRTYYFSSAVYAYFYIFNEGPHRPGMWNQQFRTACEFYNHGLAKSLRRVGGDLHSVKEQEIKLPMKKTRLEMMRAGYSWPEAQLRAFVPADDFVVHGLRPRERSSGLGVPLIATPDWSAFGTNWPDYFLRDMKVPATLFLRVEGSVCDMAADRLQATLELYSGFSTRETAVNGQTVPLEVDYSATLAYMLQHSVQWKARIAQFFTGLELIKSRIYLSQPYAPYKIPVIFVYGTGGSPSDWANAYNMLRADPDINTHYQFWYFVYNTGNPISYSGARLRESLDKVIKELDPEGKDDALRKAIVIGHSQGGLVTKLSAVDSGDVFWNYISDKPLDQLKLSPESRELLRNMYFFEHSPYVHRVILVCAPNQGSVLVNNWMQNLGQFLISMPVQLTRLGTDLATLYSAGKLKPAMKQFAGKVPTSVANMNPNNPFLKALYSLPLADDIKGNTIIGVLGDGPVEECNDGVVAYTSARLPGMESEDIVHGNHDEVLISPVTAECIRRILLQPSK